MRNQKIIAIIVCIIAVITAVVLGVFLLTSDNDKKDNDTEKDEGSTLVNSGNENNGDGTGSIGNSDNNSSAQEKEEAALSERILGLWRDSANMSGYEFKENNAVEITYVNITVPVLNIPVNGTYSGTYTLTDNTLTITSSIYTATISDTYTVTVTDNTLTLVNTESGDVSTYTRATSSSITVEPDDSGVVIGGETDSTALAGSWVTSDSSRKYIFYTDGSVSLTVKDKTYNGIYVADSDSVTLQYSVGSQNIKEEFEYKISGNMLYLSGNGISYNLTRSGTSSSEGTDSELLGLWRDSANMSGYEFKDGGIVEVTYVNVTVPVINELVKGTFTGSYIITGNSIQITSSIYGASISDTYTYAINGNVLTLTAGDGNVSTYIKQ